MATVLARGISFSREVALSALICTQTGGRSETCLTHGKTARIYVTTVNAKGDEGPGQRHRGNPGAINRVSVAGRALRARRRDADHPAYSWAIALTRRAPGV